MNGGERARVRADGGPVALECAVECKYYYYRAGWGQWCSCKRGGMLVVDSQSVPSPFTAKQDADFNWRGILTELKKGRIEGDSGGLK